MLAIPGIYDGKSILPLEAIPTQRKYKIIITFVEEITEDEDIRAFVAQPDTFEFWENEAEDLYQDFLPKNPPQA